jgi:hypothetical protein
LPRRGHEASECQDACAVDAGRGRFAVADGATESAWSGPWARLLAESFVNDSEGGPESPGWLCLAQERWREAVRQPTDAEPLPWFLQEQHEQGAFATFLGLVVEGRRWHALAVGDSCLFQVRRGRLRAAFPLEGSAQFGSTPALVGSRGSPDEVLQQRRQHTGEVRRGDRLWLMTDALACWFLTEVEAGHRPWLHLQDLDDEPDSAFGEWVDRLRAGRKLRNDDTTLVALWG